MQIHDPNTFQCYDFISEIFTHTTDLAVQPLGKDDTKTVLTCFCNLAGTCDRIKNRHPATHATDKFFRHRFIHGYLIFLFMIVSRLHDAVHQISFIGKEKQAFGIFIQPSYGINPHRIIQIFCYCHLIPLLSGATDNPFWFMKKKQDLFFLFFYRLSVNTDLRIREDLHSCGNQFSISSNSPRFCQSVCLSS